MQKLDVGKTILQTMRFWELGELSMGSMISILWDDIDDINTHDGSMVLLHMLTWIPSIYPSHVSICSSTMDPLGYDSQELSFESRSSLGIGRIGRN